MLTCSRFPKFQINVHSTQSEPACTFDSHYKKKSEYHPLNSEKFSTPALIKKYQINHSRSQWQWRLLDETKIPWKKLPCSFLFALSPFHGLRLTWGEKSCNKNYKPHYFIQCGCSSSSSSVTKFHRFVYLPIQEKRTWLPGVIVAAKKFAQIIYTVRVQFCPYKL